MAELKRNGNALLFLTVIVLIALLRLVKTELPDRILPDQKEATKSRQEENNAFALTVSVPNLDSKHSGIIWQRQLSRNRRQLTAEEPREWRMKLSPHDRFSVSEKCHVLLYTNSLATFLFNAARKELGLAPLDFSFGSPFRVPTPAKEKGLDNVTSAFHLRGSSNVNTVPEPIHASQRRQLTEAEVDSAERDRRMERRKKLSALLANKDTNRAHPAHNNRLSGKDRDRERDREKGRDADAYPPHGAPPSSSSLAHLRTRRRNSTLTDSIGVPRTKEHYSRMSMEQRQSILAWSSLKSFYSVSLGCTSVPIFDTEVTYVTLWKCANDAIRLNLLAQAEREFNAKQPPHEVIAAVETASITPAPTLSPGVKPAARKKSSVRDPHNFVPKNYFFNFHVKYARHIYQTYNTHELPPAFTFVREPTSHFVSGLTEFYWREHHTETITAERLKDDLFGFFNITKLHDKSRDIAALTSAAGSNALRFGVKGQKPPAKKVKAKTYELKHFAAMSGVLKQRFNLQFVGKLESFDEDWKRVNDMYGINVLLDPSLGVHPTSKDPNGVKAAFNELFASAESVRWKRALCYLLLADYVCFDYAMPPECSDITADAVFAAAEVDQTSAVADIKKELENGRNRNTLGDTLLARKRQATKKDFIQTR